MTRCHRRAPNEQVHGPSFPVACRQCGYRRRSSSDGWVVVHARGITGAAMADLGTSRGGEEGASRRGQELEHVGELVSIFTFDEAEV